MTALELPSAVREGSSLVVTGFVDGAFGQIRMQQLMDYGASRGVELENPDFNLLAAAFEARHELVGDNIEAVVLAALARHGVTVLEVPVENTLAICRTAAMARAREATRRATVPRVFRLLKKLFRTGR